MITLNDYLYSGDTVLRILQKYMGDLREEAKRNHNEIDTIHCNFLLQIKELLEHNDFLTSQSQKIRHLYRIANALPAFLEERGFTAEPSGGIKRSTSPLLDDSVRPYYRDYIEGENPNGYRSLHITFYDNSARCYMEIQLRTKDMDDMAEIGVANHLGYEKKQEYERARRDAIPEGECIYFDEAYERGMKLQQLELSKVDVNMFTAVDNSLMNDGCGLYRGRWILPYEHLSRFQNDLID